MAIVTETPRAGGKIHRNSLPDFGFGFLNIGGDAVFDRLDVGRKLLVGRHVPLCFLYLVVVPLFLRVTGVWANFT